MIDKIANELIIASVIERTNQVQVIAEKIGYQHIVIMNARTRGAKTDKLVYIRTHTSGGVWITNSNVPALGAWSHIVITYDQSSTSNDPIIYVDGVSVAVTEFDTPTGTPLNQYGSVLDIGNSSSFSSPYSGCLNGKIYDMRIYNRILTANDVNRLYQGTSEITSGLVFQGPAVYTDRPLSAGHVLTSTDRLVENILRAVGIPNGSPTIRAYP